MSEIFGIPIQAFMGQLMLGLVNGSFYATLSLGLAVIFGMLNIINFAHGALYMAGAMLAWMGLNYFGIGYWWSLLLAPLGVGAVGVIIERSMLQWLYKLDHLYGLLLTFGLALILEGLFRDLYGSLSYGRYARDITTGAGKIANDKNITSVRLAYNLAGFETGVLAQWVRGDGDPGETGVRADIKQYRMKAFLKAIF